MQRLRLFYFLCTVHWLTVQSQMFTETCTALSNDWTGLTQSAGYNQITNDDGLCPSNNVNNNCWEISAEGYVERIVSTIGFTNVQLTYSMTGAGVNGQEQCNLEYSTTGGEPYPVIDFIDSSSQQIVAQTYSGWTVDNVAALRIRLTNVRGGHQCYFNDLTLSGTSAAPTNQPSTSPTKQPSTSPTKQPSTSPTDQQSSAPTTDTPTSSPTTATPTSAPTTDAPTDQPSSPPTTSEPSTSPTTGAPTSQPSISPTDVPTTGQPSSAPPTGTPTRQPSISPTDVPTTGQPSTSPTTGQPSATPTTAQPSATPAPTTGVVTNCLRGPAGTYTTYCYYVDVLTANDSVTQEIVTIQQPIDTYTSQYEIFFTPRGAPCWDPLISVTFDQIDFDGSNEYADVFDDTYNSGTYWRRCNGLSQGNCGSFWSCFSNLPLQNSFIAEGTEYNLRIESNMNNHAVCGSWKINARLTITCDIPPTPAPSATPTQFTVSPTSTPTQAPSTAPSAAPTAVTTEPSNAPSIAPTHPPTTAPTQPPSRVPSDAPTQPPSTAPSQAPSLAPSDIPTAGTDEPSNAPSTSPSKVPSNAPTQPPSTAPSTAPTPAPTDVPTDVTSMPSGTPSTADPTTAPTVTICGKLTGNNDFCYQSNVYSSSIYNPSTFTTYVGPIGGTQNYALEAIYIYYSVTATCYSPRITVTYAPQNTQPLTVFNHEEQSIGQCTLSSNADLCSNVQQTCLSYNVRRELPINDVYVLSIFGERLTNDCGNFYTMTDVEVTFVCDSVPTMAPTDSPTIPTTHPTTAVPTSVTRAPTPAPTPYRVNGTLLFDIFVISHWRIGAGSFSLILVTFSHSHVELTMKKVLRLPILFPSESINSVSEMTEYSFCFNDTSECTQFWNVNYVIDNCDIDINGDLKYLLQANCIGTLSQKRKCLELLRAEGFDEKTKYTALQTHNFKFLDKSCSVEVYKQSFNEFEIKLYKSAQFSHPRKDNKKYKKGDVVYMELVIDNVANDEYEINNIFVCSTDKNINLNLTQTQMISGIGGCLLNEQTPKGGIMTLMETKNQFYFTIPTDLDIKKDRLYIQIQATIAIENRNKDSNQIRHFMTEIELNAVGYAATVSDGLSGGATAGIVIGVILCLVGVIVAVYVMKAMQSKQKEKDGNTNGAMELGKVTGITPLEPVKSDEVTTGHNAATPDSPVHDGDDTNKSFIE